MHNQCAPDPFGVTNNCVAGSETGIKKRQEHQGQN
ncbi:hypothetical protein T03_13378, partial [Trichinella britovi]